jgi:hypothetical protein
MKLPILIGLVLQVCLLVHPAAAEGPVWHWYAQCSPTRTIQMEVMFKQKPIYQASFPACAMRREEKLALEEPQRILAFFFQAPASLFGNEYKRLGTRRIEGNIWEAGSDPDAILLGVSFDTGNQILLNTIHVAEIDKPTQTTLASGLIIRTRSVEMK